MSFEGRTVLVTGAGRGIGAGIARCFAERGANVVVTDLSEELAQSGAANLPGRRDRRAGHQPRGAERPGRRRWHDG